MATKSLKKTNGRGVEIAVFLAGIAFSGLCLAAEIEESKCQPTATPVTTCNCPVAPGAPIVDRCEGSLPVSGNEYYGDVDCTFYPSSTCQQSTGNSNACGRVVRCLCADDCNISFATTPLTCTCTVFLDKPNCLSNWGKCQWTQAKL